MTSLNDADKQSSAMVGLSPSSSLRRKLRLWASSPCLRATEHPAVLDGSLRPPVCVCSSQSYLGDRLSLSTCTRCVDYAMLQQDECATMYVTVRGPLHLIMMMLPSRSMGLSSLLLPIANDLAADRCPDCAESGEILPFICSTLAALRDCSITSLPSALHR